MKTPLTLLICLMATTWLAHADEQVTQLLVNHCPVTPVRTTPSERSEQSTQLLFGEVCELLETRGSWVLIRSTQDGQEGWVSRKMMTSGGTPSISAAATVAVPMAVATDTETGEQLMLTIGTRLPNYRNGTFEVLGKQYQIDPKAVYRLLDNGRSQGELLDGTTCLLDNGSNSAASLGEDVVRVARSLLNVPYLWGGKNIMGFDCSGFTQTVYSVFGINLLRNAREQFTQGQVVNSLAEAQPGDLVFFDHADRDPNATNISHVGMLISPTEVIHCSGCVHIDRIDEQGIYLENGEMTHHLVQIKRYLP